MEKGPLFLSYAWSDATEFAKKLRADLEGLGYEVWRDRDQILAGDDFIEKICAGIRASKLVIALMTPGSVRLASDPANQTRTDSVCINEVQEARFRAKIPIIPVMARKCEAPFAINTLDYVDITRFEEDGQAWADGLARITKRIESVLAGEAVPTRLRPAALDLLDETFDRFLGDLRDGFCGRQWLFEQIDAWLAKDGPQVLVITGAPGSGKSAIAAELVRRNSGGQVLAYHVCKADRPPTIAPEMFVRSISDMIATRIDGYRAAIENPRKRELLAAADQQAGAAFDAAVLGPLSEITRDRPCYLLIDAMDEARAFTDKANILDLLVSSIRHLPQWLRLVVTCRPGEAERRLDLPQSWSIGVSGDKNRDDVRAYIDFRLQSPKIKAKLAEAGRTPGMVAAWVKDLDAGNDESNMLFAKLLLNEVEARPAEQLSESALPRELDAIYESAMRRFFEGLEEAQQKNARRLLGIVSAAAESAARGVLAEAAGPDSGDLLATMLRELAAYLPESNGRIRAFHKTYVEWLAKEDNPYGADLQEGRRSLAAMCRRDFQKIENLPDEKEIPRDTGNGVRTYMLRHGVTHLIEDGGYATAVDLLALLFEHEGELEESTALALGVSAKEISQRLGDCDSAVAEAVDPLKLASVVRRFYEIEPQYGGISMLVAYHWDRWEAILDNLLSDDDFVIRFTIARALADGVKGKSSPKLSYIFGLLKSPDVNRQELGGYALKLVYVRHPGWIDTGMLNTLARSEFYSGRSILGDLLLNLAFLGQDRSSLVTETRFWEPIWDFNRLDVWTLKAIIPFVAGSVLPAGVEEEIRAAYKALQEAEAIRQELLNEGATTPVIRDVLENYRSLGSQGQVIRPAQEGLEKSPSLRKLMRLCFAHPLWDVAEEAASVLSDMPREVAAPIIGELLADSLWRVRYGGIEAAFGIRYVDDYELFSRAVRALYNDANCMVRALCVENFTAMVVACDFDERARWLREFAVQIKAWVRDEDCWVLEHVYRLFRQMDEQGDDYQPLLADGISRLFAANEKWFQMERCDFLRMIEAAKGKMAAAFTAG